MDIERCMQVNMALRCQAAELLCHGALTGTDEPWSLAGTDVPWSFDRN